MERKIFDDEHEIFRDSVRRFCKNEIGPNRDRWHEQGQLDHDAHRKAGEQGLLCLRADEICGGTGANEHRSCAKAAG